MEIVQLEDLIPEHAKFKLASTGDVEHTLRPMNLEDEAWLAKNFTPKEIDLVFKNVKMDQICKITYHLLVDKNMFLGEHLEEVNDLGEKVKRFVSGPEKLKRAVCGMAERLVIFNALLTTIGLSRPVREAIEQRAEEAQKKNQPPSAGEKSMSSSPPITESTT